MVSQISILGITFHTYGFILGLAGVVVIHLFQRLLDQKGGFSNNSEKFFLHVAVGTIIGARLWHVATDFWLYQDNFLAIFKVWNGGLSIFGALLGGGVAMEYARRKYFPFLSLRYFFDAASLSIPLGQSIGRWANFVNQELYGLPTNLPWAIRIDPQNRLPGFTEFETFHPLFLYESVAMALFFFWLWRQKQTHQLGSGFFVMAYLLFYMVLRLVLDFLRIGIPVVWLGMSANQLVLVGCILMVGYRVLQKDTGEKK